MEMKKPQKRQPASPASDSSGEVSQQALEGLRGSPFRCKSGVYTSRSVPSSQERRSVVESRSGTQRARSCGRHSACYALHVSDRASRSSRPRRAARARRARVHRAKRATSSNGRRHTISCAGQRAPRRVTERPALRRSWCLRARACASGTGLGLAPRYTTGVTWKGDCL